MRSLLEQSQAEHLQSAADGREAIGDYLQFVAAAAGIAHRHTDGLLELEFSPQQHPRWPKPYRIQVAAGETSSQHLPRHTLAPSDAVAWLRDRLAREQQLPAAHPLSQPEAVHELTDRLFAAYTLDEGQVRLAGCHLEEVPFLRFTQLDAADPHMVVHHSVAIDGGEIPESLATELGLHELLPLPGRHCQSLRDEIDATIANQAATSDTELSLGVTLIVARWATGKLQFDLGTQTVTVPFAGWTTTLEAPPFECPATGKPTYHLTRLDDGQIVAAEGVEACEVSGRRMLDQDLTTCSVTGKRVDVALTEVCPVTGERALIEEFDQCASCHQQVSRAALAGGICRTCAGLTKVSANEGEIVELRDRYPALAQFRKFRRATSDAVLVVEAAGMWQRWLVVVSRDTNQPLAVATRGRLGRQWSHVEPDQWPRLLGSDATP